MSKAIEESLKRKKCNEPLTKEEFEFMLRRMKAQVKENIERAKR